MTKQAAIIDFEATKKGDGTISVSQELLETKDDGKTAFFQDASSCGFQKRRRIPPSFRYAIQS